MPHDPKPLPTGNKIEERQALHKYNKAHIKQSKQDNYNKRNVDRAREIAHEGTYTSGGRHLLGMKPVKGGAFTAEAPTTEKIPQKEGGPYSFAQQEINNLGWVIENKNISDQERSMLESARLQLINRMELGITQEQTWMNQIARSNDPNFFAGRTPDKEPDLSNYENFAEFRRGAGGNQDLSGPTTVTPTNEEEKDLIARANEHYEDDINDPDSIRNTEMHRNQGKWSGEVGNRKLNKISPIQKQLIAAGHKEEDLIKLMEKNQNRPKVTDLLKIFKK